MTAVVSLCLVGSTQVPAGVEHLTFRLIDRSAPEENPNLESVLRDAAETVATLRNEGHVVLVHCVAAQSRTPAVAMAYALLRGVPKDGAKSQLRKALPHGRPNNAFRSALTHVSMS